MDGKLTSAYDSVASTPSPLYQPCNTVAHAANSGLIRMRGTFNLDPDIQNFVAEGHLPGASTPDGKEQWPLDVQFDELLLQDNLRLYRRLLTFDPSSVNYDTVRQRRDFSGYVRVRNGAHIIQDDHAPVDLSNMDIIVT